MVGTLYIFHSGLRTLLENFFFNRTYFCVTNLFCPEPDRLLPLFSILCLNFTFSLKALLKLKFPFPLRKFPASKVAIQMSFLFLNESPQVFCYLCIGSALACR